MAGKKKSQATEPTVQPEKKYAKFNYNYAADASVSERAMSRVKDGVLGARMNRSAKEQEWLEDLQLWACQNTDAQIYEGRANLVIPELNKQIESSTNKFMDGIFPNDDYIGCIPLQSTRKEESQDIKDAVFHELHYKNKLPKIAQRFFRQKVLYGSAFMKVNFEKKMKTVFIKQPGEKEAKPTPTVDYEGARVHVLDTFHTYIFPETAQDPQSADMMFDECFIPKRVLLRDKKYYAPAVEGLAELDPRFSENAWVDSFRLQINNISDAHQDQQKAPLVTEIWCDFDIIPGEFVPCVITLGNVQVPIRIERNPFWHQKKPYLMSKYIDGPAGEAYGHSLSERIRSLQYMATDVANQTMDSMNYSLSPIALIHPGFAGDINSFKVQPGAKWFADPNGVRFETFPDISGVGFQGLSQLRGMIAEHSDLAPSLPPQLQGKPRSATQANYVEGEMSQDLKNMTRSDAFDVMSELCWFTHELLKQYMSKEYQILTQGAEKGQWIAKMVNPATLQQNALFVWKGAEVAKANAIRSQQLIAAFNMAVQMERVIPGQIDLPALYKIVMYEAFQLKDLQVFIEDRNKHSVDPKIENIALLGGDDLVPVNPGDVYEIHMPSHEEAFSQADTPLKKIAVLKHMEKHELQKQAKTLLMEQEARMKTMQAELGQEGEQEAPQGIGEQGMGGGNQMQAPSTFQGMTQGIRSSQPNM